MRSIKITLLLLSWMAGVNLNAQNGIIFSDISLTKAIETLLKQPDKHIFLDCYTSWCAPCKYMTDKVFTQPECGIYFNDKFINLKIDMESEPGKIIKEKYRIESYPTFLLLDQNGVEINRIIGRSATASEFIAKVEKALLGKIDPQPLLDTFNSSPTADNFCKYLLLLTERGEFEKFKSFLDKSFGRLPFPDKFSPAIWELVFKYTLMLHDTESFYFRFIENNKVYADEYIGKAKVDKCFIENYKRNLYYYMSDIKYSNATQEELDRIILKLSFLSIDDLGTKILADMARAKYKGDLEYLVNLVSDEIMYSLSEIDKNFILATMMELKNITPQQKEKILNYLNNEIETAGKQLNYLKKTCATFKQRTN